MSAALQLTAVWGASHADSTWKPQQRTQEENRTELAPRHSAPADSHATSLSFYRRHTESLLRRYLYASMQIGRAPSILGDPVSRGWASSRPVHTFEDAVIFVLDVERCLVRLTSVDRQILCRIVLQEYTQAETAALLGMSVRSVSHKFPSALDRLTERLLETGLLVVPQ
jgi:DNA-directed RNA polymerase specialized sigma24 family protein